jgi:hypothetical protein
MVERAHVVQAVGELDEQDAHVSAFLETRSIFLSLVSPSTSLPMSGPNSSSISCLVAVVSSIVSCSSATAIVASSACISVRIAATSSGCEK